MEGEKRKREGGKSLLNMEAVQERSQRVGRESEEVEYYTQGCVGG